MIIRSLKPVSCPVTTDWHVGRGASVLAARDKNALIGDRNTDQGNRFDSAERNQHLGVGIMQKIHPLIKRLYLAGRSECVRIGRDVRVTAGFAGAVYPCGQASGEGRS